jgi:hypothetical protein
MYKGIIFAALGTAMVVLSLIGMLTADSVNEGIGAIIALILSFILMCLGIMEINADDREPFARRK